VLASVRALLVLAVACRGRVKCAVLTLGTSLMLALFLLIDNNLVELLVFGLGLSRRSRIHDRLLLGLLFGWCILDLLEPLECLFMLLFLFDGSSYASHDDAFVADINRVSVLQTDLSEQLAILTLNPFPKGLVRKEAQSIRVKLQARLALTLEISEC
jgi:hypothetical protein